LSPEESERVCNAVHKLFERYGSQVAVAKELTMPDGTPVSQASVSLALRRMHIGVTFARAVAMKLGVSFEELVSGVTAPPDGTRRYKDLPGWAEAEAAVIEQELLPKYIVQIVGDGFVSFATRPVDAAFIVDLGMMWIKYAPLEVRKAAEKANVLAERARRLEEEEARSAALEQSGPNRRDSHVGVVLPLAPKKTREG
jgi:hypothetical protein